MSGTSSRVTGVRTVAVPVTDQDRAVAFYVDVLGLEVRMDAPLDELGGRWIEVAPPGADTSVALVPTPEGAGVTTGIRLATADATALHVALAGEGVDVGELITWPDVPPMFELRDPDGNTLVVVG